MLVLGCMRSASTSLTEFLMSITGLPRDYMRTENNTDMVRVPGYEYFPSSTASYISKEMLTDWVCSRNYIIQEHLLPLPEHREILLSIPRDQRKVVITKRNWKYSYTSNLNRRGLTPYGTLSENKSRRASFKKFREDLEIYFPPEDGYLHIEFSELIKNQSKTLAKVLDYFEISYELSQLEMGHHRWNGG